MIRPMAQEVRAKYMDGLKDVDVKEPAIHQRWSTIRERRGRGFGGEGISEMWIAIGSRDVDHIYSKGCCQVGRGYRKKCLGIRCRILWRAVGEGLG